VLNACSYLIDWHANVVMYIAGVLQCHAITCYYYDYEYYDWATRTQTMPL
jgi:hypothetical protein